MLVALFTGYGEIVRLELNLLWIIGKVQQTEDCKPGGKLAYSGENDQVKQVLRLFPALFVQTNKLTAKLTARKTNMTERKEQKTKKRKKLQKSEAK